MGAAFYSRQWDNVKDRYHGFLQYTEKGGGYGPNYTRLEQSYINHTGDKTGKLLKAIANGIYYNESNGIYQDKSKGE